MRVLQAYQYALDPSFAQEQALRSHVGARRFAFNWGLALVKARLEARAHGEAVAVPWTMRALRDEWNRHKGDVAPWWRENSKEAYNAGCDGLASALKNFFDSRQREAPGETSRLPDVQATWSRPPIGALHHRSHQSRRPHAHPASENRGAAHARADQGVAGKT